MKKNYQEPEVELVTLLAVDVISSSAGGLGTDGDHEPYDPWS